MRTNATTTTGTKRWGGAGFSLTEILVVIAILTLLLAILVPSLGKAREQARQVVCLVNIRSIGVAMTMYANANRDYVVPRTVEGSIPALNWGGPPGYPPGAGAFWTDPLYLGQYAGSDPASPTDVLYRNQMAARRSSLVCPADRQYAPGDKTAHSSYGMSALLPSVRTDNSNGPWSTMWRLSSITFNPGQELILVDAVDVRFSPGGWIPTKYFFYGITEPLRNGNYNMGGDPNSYYNWSRRHFTGANTLFLDGHGALIKDLKVSYDRKEFMCRQGPVME